MSGEPWTIAWTTVVTLSAHRCSPGSESPASAKYSQRGCHSVLAFVLPLYVCQHCLDLLSLLPRRQRPQKARTTGPFISRRAVVSGSLSMSLWQMEQVYLFGIG